MRKVGRGRRRECYTRFGGPRECSHYQSPWISPEIFEGGDFYEDPSAKTWKQVHQLYWVRIILESRNVDWKRHEAVVWENLKVK